MLLVTRRDELVPIWDSLFARHSGAETLVHNSLDQAMALAAQGAVRFCVIDVGSVQMALAPVDSGLTRLAHECRVLLIGSEFTVDEEMAALAAGIAGCCSNAVTPQEMATVFDVVMKGGIRVSKAALPRMLTRLQEAGARQAAAQGAAAGGDQFEKRWAQLTSREREIARQVAGGASNKVIARQLDISDATIKAHLTSVFQKLNVAGRLQLALLISEREKRQG
jgi:DNA-binding NarL/FixJ family response regulator